MKTRTGNLFKRNGTYYVRWRVNGKLFMRSTGERDIKKARAKRDEILAPFLAGREVDVLRNVSARIEGRTAELEKWEEQENPPLKLAEAWRTYIRCVNRPDTGPSTLEQYGGHYKQFVTWLKKNHPSVKAMRDVSPAIAEEYAQQRCLCQGTLRDTPRHSVLAFATASAISRSVTFRVPCAWHRRSSQICSGRNPARTPSVAQPNSAG